MPDFTEFRPKCCTRCGNADVTGVLKWCVDGNDRAQYREEHICDGCLEKILKNAIFLDENTPEEVWEGIKRKQEERRLLAKIAQERRN